MQKLKFSIITASFNSEKTIQHTFESILEQVYKEIEYIVVDGGSTDTTLEIIKAYEAKFAEVGIAFKWISEKDTGIYNAWNKGLKLVSGQWVSFIGSDDIYYPDTFQKYFNYILEHPNLDFISSRTKMVLDGKVVRKMGEEWNWNIFKREMKIGHSGAIHNIEYFKKYGGFDENYKITGDYELLLRAKDKLKFGFINFYAAEMGGEGVSSTKVLETLKEARKAKIETAQRNHYLASIEMYFVYLKILIKRLFKAY